jgi:hydrogenase nickel incorporation protein HypB
MCDTCGCNITPGNRGLLFPVMASGERVLGGLLKANDEQAEKNRARLDAHGVLAVNLMSSPGSGKTALLEATIRKLAGRLKIAVVEGDLETENDARRIRALGVAAHQIVTGTACHLDAHLLAPALEALELANLDILFIENVGNLVCPASFDLGHHRNVTLLSVTEGDDKPAKYPVMFRAADLMLISKVDLLPHLDDFSPAKAERCQRALSSSAPVLKLSARSGEGLDEWLAWLDAEIGLHRERLARGETRRPRVQREGRALHSANPEVHFRPVANG